MPLVLTRMPGQQFSIGPDITITIGGRNKFGDVKVIIDAPRHLDITRPDMKKRKPA